MSRTLFWVQIITHQIVCTKCAGDTNMIGWMAVSQDLKVKMYKKEFLTCSVCGSLR
jgi:hypothetical protein